MAIKTIPLSHLEADPMGTLSECAAAGSLVVLELPGQRYVAIQSLEPGADDDFINELLDSNEQFRALVAKSKASPRKAFTFNPAAE